MDDFGERVKRWRESLGKTVPDDELMRSLHNPQVRPIIERMMKSICPVQEVQMIKRNLAFSKLQSKVNSGETKPKDKDRIELEKKYKELRTKIQEKRAQELEQKKMIESLKIEVQQKHLEASNLQREIYELKKLASTVTAVSQQLTWHSKLQGDSKLITLDHKDIIQEEQQPAISAVSEIVDMYAVAQDKAIMDLKLCHIPTPPEPLTDVQWQEKCVELEVHNLALEKRLKDSNIQLEVAIDSFVQCGVHTLPDSITKEMVRKFARLRVARKRNEIFSNCLKNVITDHSSSLCSDRDYLRILLLNAEKKLNALNESYVAAQKEMLQLAEGLSCSWQNIEEAAEKARRKRSELKVECKEAQTYLPELAEKLRLAASLEIKTLHETMMSLKMRDTTEQEASIFGTIYNDLFYVLKLVADKRMANHVTLSLPEMFTPSDELQLEHLISMKSNESSELESCNKFICEWNQHMDAVLSDDDRLIQSLKDLIAIWWRPPFEDAVPEGMVVNGKNIMQHTAHWDRITSFLEKK